MASQHIPKLLIWNDDKRGSVLLDGTARQQRNERCMACNRGIAANMLRAQARAGTELHHRAKTITDAADVCLTRSDALSAFTT